MNLDLGVTPTFHENPKPQPVPVGELVSLPGAVEIKLLEGNAENLEILPDGVRALAPGRFTIRVAGGLRVVVAPLVAIAPGLMERIPIDDMKLAPGDSVENRRHAVLRSLCMWEPRFTGESFENVNLKNHGA